MMIAVPFFAGEARWYRLLEHWFECHAMTRTNVPAVVITDELALRGFPTLSVDTFAFRKAIRPGEAWDRKGAIVAASAQFLGRFLVCDLDAFLQRDPEPAMARLGDVTLATREDAWKRTIGWRGGEVTQRQAGVMWFGQSKDRATLADMYRRAFAQAGMEFEKDAWREQLAWTLVAKWSGLHELPKTLNCSHSDPDAAAACIVHEHGEKKWARIA